MPWESEGELNGEDLAAGRLLDDFFSAGGSAIIGSPITLKRYF